MVCTWESAPAFNTQTLARTILLQRSQMNTLERLATQYSWRIQYLYWMQPCTWICNLQHALAIQDLPPTFNTCTLKSVRRAIPILAADNTWICTRQYCIMAIVSARCYLIVMHCRLLLKSRNIQQRLSFFVIQVFYLPILVCCILVAPANCFVNEHMMIPYSQNTTYNRVLN